MRDFPKDLASHEQRATIGDTLPGQPPLRTWGGQGSGATCAICAEPITPDQCEYEFEYAKAGAARGCATVYVHVQCYSAWELERPAPQLAPRKP